MDGLIAEHISKTYAGTHGLSFAALRDVSIRLEPGSFTSLVGESGSGKSTLARLLVGLEAPDQGAIFLDGEDTSGWSTEDWRKRRTKLQAVFQDASGTLNPMRSVRSNVEEAMVNLMLSRSPHVPSLAGVEGSDEFLSLISEFRTTNDTDRVQEIFNQLLNFDNDNVIDLPLLYVKDMIVYNTDKIAGYDFSSTPMFFDVRLIQPAE